MGRVMGRVKELQEERTPPKKTWMQKIGLGGQKK